MLGSLLSGPAPSLLAFFSLLRRVQGDCGPPPKLSNALPYNNVDGKTFHPGESVSYKCLDGFYNVHAKLDIVTCLSDSTWTDIAEFCERVCSRPPRFKYAKIKAGDTKTYYPAKTRVTYVCRPGYNTIAGINSVITCLDNYTWTALPVFCEGKSCGDPGKPENGEAVILTDLLYLAKVNFICKEGYELIGSSSTECVLKGDGVEWEANPPKCQWKKKPSKGETIKPEIGSTQSPGSTVHKNESGTSNTTGIVVGTVVGIIILAAAVTAYMKCRPHNHQRTL